ncbi:MAG: phage-like protein [Candidatus Frackibacter sp. T328-2]|nr:MAG: phage-like protein [Candidatus Frackibacter sp. T328-2]
MSKTVDVDDLAQAITEEVKKYTDDVSEAIENEVNETSKDVRKYTKDHSPENDGEYKMGWRRRKSIAGGRIEITVYNRKKPSLVHLLEFGHAKVGGGRVRAYPHLRPGYNKFVPTMEKRIELIIRNGGGLY